jgi:predicted O-methyltransferase YrrM
MQCEKEARYANSMAMNPVLTELLETGSAVSEDGRVHKIRSQIPLEEGLFLERIVSEVKPAVSLEVGLAYGVSTLFICKALESVQNPHHIVIDPNQLQSNSTHDYYEGVGLYNLRRAGYERMIEFHASPSYLALPLLVSRGVKVDFAFIDGWHTFDFASVDFFYVDLLLRTGGEVVIDDTHFPSVRKLCRYIVTNRPYRVTRCLAVADTVTRHPLRWLWLNGTPRVSRALYRITHRDGLLPHSRCIAFRKEADDTRSWDFHRDF